MEIAKLVWSFIEGVLIGAVVFFCLALAVSKARQEQFLGWGAHDAQVEVQASVTVPPLDGSGPPPEDGLPPLD